MGYQFFTTKKKFVTGRASCYSLYRLSVCKGKTLKVNLQDIKSSPE